MEQKADVVETNSMSLRYRLLLKCVSNAYSMPVVQCCLKVVIKAQGFVPSFILDGMPKSSAVLCH